VHGPLLLANHNPQLNRRPPLKPRDSEPPIHRGTPTSHLTLHSEPNLTLSTSLLYNKSPNQWYMLTAHLKFQTKCPEQPPTRATSSSAVTAGSRPSSPTLIDRFPFPSHDFLPNGHDVKLPTE
jgi:hypothetical protein